MVKIIKKIIKYSKKDKGKIISLKGTIYSIDGYEYEVCDMYGIGKVNSYILKHKGTVVDCIRFNELIMLLNL